MRHLNGKIATNQVKLGDLDEEVQGLVQELQSTRQDVEDGKQLDAEKLITFEEIIVAVENATQTRHEEITRLALELDHARKQQQEANERQSRREVVSSQLHANIMGQGKTSANTLAKKYLASDPSALRPDASDLASAFSMPCAPRILLQRALSPDATSRRTDALSTP